ncbi:MAG: preprotein translocase subunit SecY [Candidatus Aureabacteria bacterium]|nr:preprotein translocase subunit SecY [Candidatus Auribacterota bacterium]
MLDAFKNIFKIPELRKRILFTLGLLAVCRIGTYVPVPGINGKLLADWFAKQQGTIFGLMDLFSGGSLSKCTVFALGIMPYISASIILQLLIAAVPYLEKLAKEGELGRKKLTQYTRYGTVVLGMFQGFMISGMLIALNNQQMPGIVPDAGLAFRLITMLTLTAGTAFLMWIGEQITERGIGNGISLIITIGILSRLPSALFLAKDQLISGQLSVISMVVLIVLMVGVVAGVVAVSQGQRKIPVQYAKRIVGRKVYGGQASFLPLRVGQAGVIPIIFASSILMFPQTLGQMTNIKFFTWVSNWLSYGGSFYTFLYALLIIAFSFFWTAMQFNPIQISDDLKKYGGFVPGIRPGKPTSEYLENVMVKVTFVGALAITLIAIMPQIIGKIFNVDFRISQFFGGTGLLIIVGVMLDTMRQVESHLIMRHYEGFVKKGRLKGRI